MNNSGIVDITSRRMTEHIQNGAMKDHMRNFYRNILTRTEMNKNICCIKRFDNVKSKNYM